MSPRSVPQQPSSPQLPNELTHPWYFFQDVLDRLQEGHPLLPKVMQQSRPGQQDTAFSQAYLGYGRYARAVHASLTVFRENGDNKYQRQDNLYNWGKVPQY